MSNVIYTGEPIRTIFEGEVNYYHNSLKIGESSYYLGVGDVSFAISYRYWKFNVLAIKNVLDPEFVEVMNVYFYQNSVTQSTVGVVATGGLTGFEAQNLLEENTDIWRDNFSGSPVYVEFDFGRRVTLDEIKWKTSSNIDTGVDPKMITVEATNDVDRISWNLHRFNDYISGVTDERAQIVGDLFLDEQVFFNTIPPPSGGYTIYDYKERMGPSIFIVNDDIELLQWIQTNLAPSISTIEDGLVNIINSTTTFMRPIACFNLVHEKITLRECKVAVDSSFVMSYPGTGIVWYNLVNTLDESFNLVNVELNKDFFDQYPELETSPGGNSFRFEGNGQSANFDMRTNSSDPITIELWCKFNDIFSDGMVFGFYNYGVYCSNENIGFTATNFDTESGRYDLYGFNISGKGLTGSYVHIVFKMYAAGGTYLPNEIYLNGVSQDLSQIYGYADIFVFDPNVNFNGGLGRLAGTRNTESGIDSLNFSCQVFRVYDSELTTDEISLNYSAFQSRF